MNFKYFSKNGKILPVEKAQIPLSNIEYAYGFGVYETLRVRSGIVYFVSQHVNRLLKSAEIIGLTHRFSEKTITDYIFSLIAKESADAYNIKILLIGGKTKTDAQIFIIPLSPLFSNRKFYTEGVKTVTYNYERLFPKAKTLNMLGSFLAFRKARENNCYDALLIDKQRNIFEGTRTNFFAIKDNILFTQPDEKILSGITRETVIFVAKNSGCQVKEENINVDFLFQYDSAFLTSSSSKILPIKQIDDFVFPKISDELKTLMKYYDTFLKDSNGVFR